MHPRSYFEYLISLVRDDEVDTLGGIIDSDSSVVEMRESFTGSDLLDYAIDARVSRRPRGGLAMVRMLLDHGFKSNINISSGGTFPVHTAVGNSDVDLLELLLQSGANPNQFLADVGRPVDLALRNCESQPGNSETPILDLLRHYGGEPATEDEWRRCGCWPR